MYLGMIIVVVVVVVIFVQTILLYCNARNIYNKVVVCSAWFACEGE